MMRGLKPTPSRLDSSMGYFFSVFLGTFLLEDVALVTALTFIGDGKLSLIAAFFACFLGISVGDILLYLLGRFAFRLGLEDRVKSNLKIKTTLYKMKNSGLLTYMIFVSRLIPGTRLPTYVAAGVLNYSFLKFTLLTLISVGAWVSLALAAGKSLQYFLTDHIWLSLLLFIALILVIKKISPLLVDPWKRKASLHSWRKWKTFEFWPSWFFYIPIVFWYIVLSVRYRSFLNPFYANPKIFNGGLLGESKWDFLQYLDPHSKATLPALIVKKESSLEDFLVILEKNNFNFPFIVKPDIGQRGFGVRIIRNKADLNEYLLLSNFDLVLQRLSNLPREAGIFYIKIPNTQKEFIFSITDKKFPFVTGDKKTKLGDLILNDPRARIIAPTYFSRHEESLNVVLDLKEKFYLSECGNHCQGAIFINGSALKTEKLLQEISKIASRLPEFYFGRFDIRYATEDSLKNGEFEILEINGAGSEATHIWDANTTIIEAYSTLFKQWKLLFEVGHQIKNRSDFKSNMNLGLFLKESYKVYFRKEKLSVSS